MVSIEDEKAPDDLVFLTELLGNGVLNVSADRRFTLEDLGDFEADHLDVDIITRTCK